MLKSEHSNPRTARHAHNDEVRIRQYRYEAQQSGSVQLTYHQIRRDKDRLRKRRRYQEHQRLAKEGDAAALLKNKQRAQQQKKRRRIVKAAAELGDERAKRLRKRSHDYPPHTWFMNEYEHDEREGKKELLRLLDSGEVSIHASLG